jgi:hypothetical protein
MRRNAGLGANRQGAHGAYCITGGSCPRRRATQSSHQLFPQVGHGYMVNTLVSLNNVQESGYLEGFDVLRVGGG